MNKMVNIQELFVWSAPLNVPIWRRNLPRLPVHTFATVNNNWITPPSGLKDRSYWYCAGDFIPTSKLAIPLLKGECCVI